MTKIVALAGGVGGAKLVDGLAQALPAEDLTVVVNTGDDFEHLGLWICPDLDTVCYTMAGLANPKTGWGRLDESWQTYENLQTLGGPKWFKLGDRDLATHLERTRRMKEEGHSLSQITADFCEAWGVGPKVLPMSDHPVPTIVLTAEGELSFQEYFVHRACEPKIKGFRYQDSDKVEPAPGVITALEESDLVVICPSNPWVSIDPILSLDPIRSLLESVKVVAVSPIIAGETIKGPAAKMYRELGIDPSAAAVAQHYSQLLDGFVFDNKDSTLKQAILRKSLLTDTIMNRREDRLRLAEEVLVFAQSL